MIPLLAVEAPKLKVVVGGTGSTGNEVEEEEEEEEEEEAMRPGAFVTPSPVVPFVSLEERRGVVDEDELSFKFSGDSVEVVESPLLLLPCCTASRKRFRRFFDFFLSYSWSLMEKTYSSGECWNFRLFSVERDSVDAEVEL
ncbi:hypothetical protein TYRP_012723 [Tyrophagus putrescentiae]|nr:hypothetical protein TYRP_012723 [Tyrophagus putrescentiae]